MGERVRAVGLDAEDAAAAAVVLARAFLMDPIWSATAPNPAERVRVLPVLFGGLVRYCLSCGVVTTTPDVAGAACWLAPGRTEMRPLRALGAGFEMARGFFMLSGRARRRFVRSSIGPERAHKRLMSGSHWYLILLGVDPAQQGRGVGSTLLAPVLERADAAGLPCYLETQTAGNVAFYEHRGFRVLEADVMPVIDVPVWYMVREPRGGRPAV